MTRALETLIRVIGILPFTYAFVPTVSTAVLSKPWSNSKVYTVKGSTGSGAENSAYISTAHANDGLLNDYATGHEVTQALGLEDPRNAAIDSGTSIDSNDNNNAPPPGSAAAAAAAAAALEPLNPMDVRVVKVGALEASRSSGDGTAEQTSEAAAGFVNNIRSAGPYLHMHAGQTMVVHLSSALFEMPSDVLSGQQSSSVLGALMDDLALVKLLGVRLVLVVSVRRQVDERLAALGLDVEYVGDWQVTSGKALQVVKEMSGAARATVEARLSRSLRTPSGHNGASQGVRVASSNLFYATQPLGVRGGVDFGYAGDVRRVDTQAIQRHLASGDVVLLTSLGYAASGEAYNVVSEALAAECAAALKAKKLIWVNDGHVLTSAIYPTKGVIQSMRMSDATALLNHFRVPASGSQSSSSSSSPSSTRRQVPAFSAPEYSPSSLSSSSLSSASSGISGGGSTAFGVAPSGFASIGVGPPEGAPAPRVWYAQRPPLTKPTAATKVNDDSKDDDSQGGSDDNEIMPSDASSASSDDNGSHRSKARRSNSAPEQSVSPVHARPRHAGRFHDRPTAELVNLVRFSVEALRRGVARAHVVPPQSGDLLRELYTTDGAGTLIARDLYDGIRKATDSDIPGILAIIEPLAAQGILVRRSASDLVALLGSTYVFVRDGTPVVCGILKRYGANHAEIACLAVRPEYRGGKRGDAMLTYLERVALSQGIRTVFVLSTRTLEFFAERGFLESSPAFLPPERPYNRARGSKVFMKELRGARDLDFEELFWDSSRHLEDDHDSDGRDGSGMGPPGSGKTSRRRRRASGWGAHQTPREVDRPRKEW